MLTQNFSHATQTNYKHKQEKRKKSELTPTKLKLKRKIKVLLQKIRRQTKISSLKGIIDNLKRNHLLKEAPYELQKEQFSGLTLRCSKMKCKLPNENVKVIVTLTYF